MKRVKLIVAYDGTKYHGWQIQQNGITVEEILNRRLSELLDEDIAVIGASRTDAGVHALANVAVFDTNTKIPSDKICYALNQRLPEDIVIQHSSKVADDFHPRRCDSIKTYEYRILNSPHPRPLVRLYTHFVYYPLDIEAMRIGAAYLIGTHNFKSFCTVGAQVKDTIRTIYSIDVERNEDIVVIRVTGNGFLYNMVRIIAGTLLKVGHHLKQPDQVKTMLEAEDRSMAGPTAPPEGLTMIGIEFL